MWLKDKSGNWFILQDTLFTEIFGSYGTWFKDENGDWIKDMQPVEMSQVSLTA
ncbi:hypothetical protein SAMN03080603_01226 [Acetomicrobium thermoterrenum DSM 13490]|uniref:Uncharacterized protein n=1 Tax=Acetomicrobium thermoterrenum DSM 13490 TaxID=1120987 RepID=A0A1H3FS93_9BACT|nr:hypothetical protein [Acetomicrobium thermoterrenum]SDX93800.1 hypothetical protein SAMN03080603_01226 [Acetomicrobium thermoterrenum DSM 13490]